MNYTIPVVFLTDNNYVIPTSVAIQSMIDNNKKNNFLEIYIITKDVNQNNIKCFNQFDDKRIKINIINVKNVNLERYDEEGYYVASTALLKFDIAELLPQYDKVLYLDGDVLVTDDISDLYCIDVDEYYVAATPDQAAIEACHFDEHLGVRNYFNSGVMLLNAKLIREDNLRDRLYEVKKNHPEYRCMDQDVLNDVFKDRVLFLPPKYNLMFYNFVAGNFCLKRVNAFYNVQYDSWEEMEEDAIIIHLTNEKKPWKYKEAYKSKEWMDYYSRTPFYKNGHNLRIESDEAKIFHKGFLVKTVTPKVTTIAIGKIPVAMKYRNPDGVKIKIFGFPILRKKVDGFTFKYYFMGIRYKRIMDHNYFIHRINTYRETLENAIKHLGEIQVLGVKDVKCNELGDFSEQMQLYSQFERLKQMKEDYERKNK